MCRAARPGDRVASFVGNVLTSDPVRHARTAAVLDAEPALGLGSPTNAWASAAFSMMGEFQRVGYAGKICQPILMIAGGPGRDGVDGGDRGFCRKAARRFASHHRRLAARDDDGNRPLSCAILGRVRRFVPGTPMYSSVFERSGNRFASRKRVKAKSESPGFDFIKAGKALSCPSSTGRMKCHRQYCRHRWSVPMRSRTG